MEQEAAERLMAITRLINLCYRLQFYVLHIGVAKRGLKPDCLTVNMLLFPLPGVGEKVDWFFLFHPQIANMEKKVMSRDGGSSNCQVLLMQM